MFLLRDELAVFISKGQILSLPRGESRRIVLEIIIKLYLLKPLSQGPEGPSAHYFTNHCNTLSFLQLLPQGLNFEPCHWKLTDSQLLFF